MNLWESIVFGVIQGITEFLPVSSSGHIELAKAFFDIKNTEAGLLYTVVLHFATALSTLIIFKKDIQKIILGLIQLRWNSETKYSSLILLSMVPAGFVGFFFKAYIDQLYSGNVALVCILLLVTGLVLYVSDRLPTSNGQVKVSSAFILGVVQAFAILPGISRSGSTIATAVILGIEREQAARFSFLMVLPLIFGAMVKEFMDYQEHYSLSETSFVLDLPLVAGFIAALLTGMVACKWMISMVKNSRLAYFAYYCWAVGLIGILLNWLN